MTTVFENVFSLFIDFASDLISGLNNVLPNYIDLSKSINIYLFSDNLIFSITLQEIIFWISFIGLLYFVFKIIFKILKAPFNIWYGGVNV